MSEQLYRWVKASDRLPEKKGKENSVVIECKHPGREFITSGYRNFSEKHPALYMELGSLSFLTTEGKWDFHSTVPVDSIYWLEPYTPSLNAGSLEEAAKKHADNECGKRVEYTRKATQQSRGWENYDMWDAVKESFLAGAAYVKGGEENAVEPEKEFQVRVNDWMQVCFGEEISKDIQERNHRFIEEALELVQTTGATASECHQLVDYVFGRPVGETNQEIGGVVVTLAALCNAIGMNVNSAGETELKRIWTKVDKIREKQANKPKHSPLPQSPQTPRTARFHPDELDTEGEHPSDKEPEGIDLGKCHECKKNPATKDYNGHGYFVCDPCYKSLSNEFDEEYK